MPLNNPVGSNLPTFSLLDDIVTILGGTKLTFYPFLSGFGTDVLPYGTGSDAPVAQTSDDAGVVAREAEFDPLLHVGGVYSYYNDSSVNNHINCGDDVAFSHGNATVDTAFSCGAWIMMTEAIATQRSLFAKFVGAAEEYDFRLDTSGNLVLELHDASASATEIGTASGQEIDPFVWQFVVATYDGAQAAPAVHLYTNATDGLSGGGTTESGSYVAMENTSSVLIVGARNTTAAPAFEFEGRIALPFMCGKELTSANVASLHGIGQILLGLA